MKKNIRTIIISRTDAIGDVVLTLPMAEVIKKLLGKNTKVIFFGRRYTFPVIKCAAAVDEFIDYDEFSLLDKNDRPAFLKKYNADAIVHVYPRKEIAECAHAAGIRVRTGTTNRLFHWFTCNSLVRLGRKNSNLHEAQLNLKLLKPYGYKDEIHLNEIPSLYRFEKTEMLPVKYDKLLERDKFRIILHPKSSGSAREWKLDNYRDLIRFLSPQRFQIIITGGEKEAPMLQEWSKSFPANVMNVSGLLNLDELIALIKSCDGIVAASTGPLHIGAALGKFALGIFPPIRPIHPQRWAPLGEHAEYLVNQKNCSDCRSNPAGCICINDISPAMVEQRIALWLNQIGKKSGMN